MLKTIQERLGSTWEVLSVRVKDVGDGYLYITSTVKDILMDSTQNYTLTVIDSISIEEALDSVPDLIVAETIG